MSGVRCISDARVGADQCDARHPNFRLHYRHRETALQHSDNNTTPHNGVNNTTARSDAQPFTSRTFSAIQSHRHKMPPPAVVAHHSLKSATQAEDAVLGSECCTAISDSRPPNHVHSNRAHTKCRCTSTLDHTRNPVLTYRRL